MTIRRYKDISPSIAQSAYIDESAVVIGDVHIGEDSSLWPMVVARGDVNSIRIGARSNIQDGSVLHVTHAHPEVPAGHPLLIGDEVTVGHHVTLHGCRIGNQCLIGMGSIILDGAQIHDRVYIGAGSLVPPGKELEGGYLYLGQPVKRTRELSEQEIARFHYSALHYIKIKNAYR